MLTARAQTEDRIVGLQAGADDYMTKPFSPKELILRVQSVLRRAENPPGAVELEFGPFLFNKNNMKFYMDGEPVDLTATEFKLLNILAQRRGRVQTREQLLQDVWNYDNIIDTRTVDTHVRRLREKLGAAARYLGTVRGVGYRFSTR